MTSKVHFLIVIVCSTGACTGPGAPRDIVRDSAGVVIVTNMLDGDAGIEQCAVDASPIFRIGAQDGVPAVEFTQVVGAARLSGEQYVVLDRRTRELRFFDANGRHLHTAGRDGEGPGEFRDPIQLIVQPPDSLVVFDWELQRLSWFSASGEFIRSVALRPAQGNPVPDISIVGPDQVVWMATHTVQLASGKAFVDQTLELLRFDRGGQLTDTIATLPYGSRGWVSFENRMAGRPLFEARSTWTARSERVFVATGTRDEIEIWNPAGALERLVRWTGLTRAVTPEMVARYRAEQLAPHLGTASEPLMRRRYHEVPVAEALPSVVELLVDPERRIWARQYPVPGVRERRWLVFDATGQFRCRATFEDKFQVHSVDGKQAVGVQADALDVQHVISYGVQVGSARE